MTDEKKPEINLVVTRGGVPFADQNEGIRLFKEACLTAKERQKSQQDIPADVLAAAKVAMQEAVADDKCFNPIAAIASAIMAERERFVADFDGAADAGIDAAVSAERERCAKIADEEADKLKVREGGRRIELNRQIVAQKVMARDIASRIRGNYE